MKLIIVESPAKSKTILKCLGKDYTVVASMGHIRDLPAKEIGIDIDDNFKPKYITIRGKGATVKKIKKQAKAADEIYLALDMDREGEAIAWHLSELLDIPPEKIYRVTFNEITKKAIQAAFKNPGKLDMDKVNAQQARRMLDRLVGYKLSPLLWKKIAKGLSAGRVQSVVVRLIVDREREIQAFEPKEYWEIDASLSTGKNQEPFTAALHRIKDKKPEIGSEEAAAAIVEGLKDKPFVVSEVEKKRTKKKPPPPFTTSLLQQQGSTQLRFSTRKTMSIAQQIYEGIEVGEEGPEGLITYMRTDAVRVTPDAITEARSHIESNWGSDYIPSEPNVYASRKRAQEAHEAIRPTSAERTPDSIKKYLSKDQFVLYDLIWRRFIASQMSQSVSDVTNIFTEAGDCVFKASGTQVVFDGYTAVLQQTDKKEDQLLPQVEKEQELTLLEILPKQCFTKPPPRYSEASLVKTLEKEGIGRPSTYSPIISTIIDRGYVDLENRAFRATELGTLVTDNLVKYFEDIMDLKFTSTMEEKLDMIEENKADYIKVLKEFYTPFEKDLQKAAAGMETVKAKPVERDEACPECKQPLVERWSRTGKFIGCSGFPNCRFTKSIDDDGLDDLLEAEPPCEKCGSKMVVKAGRRGKFLACSGYPKCKNTRSIPTKHTCPNEGCDGKIVERRSKRGRKFFGCSKYPDCDLTTNEIPKEWEPEKAEKD